MHLIYSTVALEKLIKGWGQQNRKWEVARGVWKSSFSPSCRESGVKTTVQSLFSVKTRDLGSHVPRRFWNSASGGKWLSHQGESRHRGGLWKPKTRTLGVHRVHRNNKKGTCYLGRAPTVPTALAHVEWHFEQWLPSWVTP